MKRIKLTQDKYALVDDSDYEWLNQWKWYYSDTGYAMRTMRLKGNYRKKIHIRMHRLIINTPNGKDTDHIDLDRLNNQRSNLRIVTRSQNKMNVSLNITNTSGYKGVGIRKYLKIKKYNARIKYNQKFINLGYFKTKKEAALAYNKAAIYYYGEFARLNQI